MPRRRDRFLLLALAATPAIAAANPVEEAEAARRGGNPARAIALLEPIAVERPDNADLLRRLGASYAAAGRRREAIATLERASALAPRDSDVRLALARARLWAGDLIGARADANAVGAADPGNVELPELLDGIARADEAADSALRGPGLGVAIGGSAVRLRGGGQRRWTEAVLAADMSLGADARLSADLEHVDREAAADTRLGLRLDTQVGRGASLWLGTTATPDADFRERWSIRGGGELEAVPRLTVFVDARHADYRLSGVTTVEPGARLASADGRWSVQLRSINLFDDGGHRSGWSGRVERATVGDAFVFAGAATYPDTEAGVTRRVRGGFVGLLAPLSPALSLRVTVDGESRARSYDRFGLNVGLSWRMPR